MQIIQKGIHEKNASHFSRLREMQQRSHQRFDLIMSTNNSRSFWFILQGIRKINLKCTDGSKKYKNTIIQNGTSTEDKYFSFKTNHLEVENNLKF